jgi:flagellar hook assembly protein FlgD
MLAIRVLGPNGATLRKLTSRAEGTGQVAQVTWDYRDGKGVSVPAGSYTVEIKATTADGQGARVLAPVVVTR